MALNKKDLSMLRNQYPTDHYNIKEQGGKLEVTPKKTVIRIFKKQLKHLRQTPAVINADSLSAELFYIISNTKLDLEDFEQKQVTVEKRTADLLTKEAKKCKTKKILYLEKLLGGLK